MFHDMHDMVHIDEKWFYITKKKRIVYKAKGEKLPPRSAKSTTHLTKVMFLGAIARPRFDCTFDGKSAFGRGSGKRKLS